jgi:hypothetical protein
VKVLFSNAFGDGNIFGSLTHPLSVIHISNTDVIVPLAWAWKNGASSWSEIERDRFANEPINLFAVSASLNRGMGAQRPDSWLPLMKNSTAST